MFKPNCKGFTLLELIIATGVLVLIASIAIPQFLRTRLDANESAAIYTLHSFSHSLESFRCANAAIGYPASLAALAPAGEPAYIAAPLAVASPTRHGYNFLYTQIPGSPSIQYHVYAEPVTPNATGIRGFYIDEQGVISSIPEAAGDPDHAPPGSTTPDGYSEIN